MLVNLCDYKQSVTLIANSGVQFLDFGLTPQDTASNGRFVRKTANGPLLRLDFDLVNGRYTVPGTNGGQPEVVKPETTIPLHQSLAVLDGVWLPVPFQRFNPPHHARVRHRSHQFADDVGVCKIHSSALRHRVRLVPVVRVVHHGVVAVGARWNFDAVLCPLGD